MLMSSNICLPVPAFALPLLLLFSVILEQVQCIMKQVTEFVTYRQRLQSLWHTKLSNSHGWVDSSAFVQEDRSKLTADVARYYIHGYASKLI